VEAKQPAFAIAARRKAIEIKASTHKATTEAEEQSFQAVYAYERVMTLERGRKTRATRQWQMITQARHHRGDGIDREESNREWPATKRS